MLNVRRNIKYQDSMWKSIGRLRVGAFEVCIHIFFWRKVVVINIGDNKIPRSNTFLYEDVERGFLFLVRIDLFIFYENLYCIPNKMKSKSERLRAKDHRSISVS